MTARREDAEARSFPRLPPRVDAVGLPRRCGTGRRRSQRERPHEDGGGGHVSRRRPCRPVQDEANSGFGNRDAVKLDGQWWRPVEEQELALVVLAEALRAATGTEGAAIAGRVAAIASHSRDNIRRHPAGLLVSRSSSPPRRVALQSNAKRSNRSPTSQRERSRQASPRETLGSSRRSTRRRRAGSTT